ncbi:MAG: RES family NAD+ phosphorylase [Verrucomicrobiota bacterium]|nr:RES family NAD+ phosphorylase [Verrucomicrobiota bacterium]
MKIFRIAAAQHTKTRAQAFNGRGGLESSGRWHTAGRLVVYTAQSLSLAALELLVHLKQTNEIQPFHSFAAEIPDHFVLKPKIYPAHWQTKLTVSQTFGNEWLDAKSSPALVVPTVLTPGEWNVLLNPAHPEFALDWVADGPHLYTFDARLLHEK